MSYRYEPDEWTPGGQKILSDENFGVIRKTLEDVGAIILEHRLYRGSRAPDRFVFDDLDDFLEYVNVHSRPGDAFYIWSFEELCKDENTLAYGKFPDVDGCVPKKGSY
ncbi:MAG: hypothetical protein M3458_05725 [Acidobacteriota bacterium]|nr:hypothetical protein [Acidobacteriota bacterium]